MDTRSSRLRTSAASPSATSEKAPAACASSVPSATIAALSSRLNLLYHPGGERVHFCPVLFCELVGLDEGKQLIELLPFFRSVRAVSAALQSCTDLHKTLYVYAPVYINTGKLTS